MKLKLIAFVAAFAASIGMSHADSGIYGFGIELDGTGAGAVNSGTTTIYGLEYNNDLQPGSVNLTGAWSGTGTFSLGTYVDGINTLTLVGGEFDTNKENGSNVTGDTLFYSLTGPSGSFTPVNMNFGADLSDGGNYQNQLWDYQSGTTNLLAGLNPGTYTITVYGEAFTSDGNAYASNGGNNFTATFTVVPEPSTWAMMFGGLVVLVGLQRLRRKSVS
jgi:hypothetical protein